MTNTIVELRMTSPEDQTTKKTDYPEVGKKRQAAKYRVSGGPFLVSNEM